MPRPAHLLALAFAAATALGCGTSAATVATTPAPDRARTPAPATQATARTPVPADFAALDAYIRQAMADWDIPGLAIAIVSGDSVVFARGYGERRAGSGEPVDEHTLFAIASTTKAMTVATLGMLVDEGRLGWDDPVARHLPWLELGDAWVGRHLTVRDLLTHRSGLARHDNLWIAAPFDRREMLRRARHLPQADGFREGYGYNNIMYMAAGELAGEAAGTSWDDLIESRLFRPLGMTRTASRFADVQARDNVATAHIRHDGRITPMDRRDYDALGPAGSVFSSAHDMARWLRLNLALGTFDGRRILDEATIREMHEPQLVTRIDTTTHRLIPSRNFSAYGLGWRLHDYHGRKVVEHTGAVNYTRTQVGMIPAEGLGVVVMTNLSSSTLQTALMYRVFDHALGLPPTDWSAEYLALARRADQRAADRDRQTLRDRQTGTRPSLPLDAYAGTYSDPLFGDVVVELHDRRLVLRYSPEYTADLEHWHHDTFRAAWRPVGFGTPFVTFTLDPRARVRSLDLEGFATFTR